MHAMQLSSETSSSPLTAAPSSSSSEPKLWVIKLLFCVLFLLEMLLNFDSGGTPAVLEFITVDFRLTPGQQGMLGAFPYIGTLFMSPFAGQLLSRYNPKICVCVR